MNTNPDQSTLLINGQSTADAHFEKPRETVLPPVTAEARVPVDAATAAVTTGEVVLPGAFTKPPAESEAITKADLENSIPARAFKLDAVAIKVIRELKCKGANDLEVAHFMYQCHALGLNPLLPGQISFAAYSKDDEEGGEERRRVIMIEIGGLRNLAARTGRHRQGDPPVLDWPDKSDHPLACTVSLYEKRDDEWVRHERTFKWEEFRQFHGRKMWKRNPAAMFPKACEAAMIRFYFFDGTAGIYTTDEIDAPDIGDLAGGAGHAATTEASKPSPSARAIYEQASKLLKVALHIYREQGMAAKDAQGAAVKLARETNPTHPGTDTWGEEELRKFQAAVDAIGVTKAPPAGSGT